MSYDHPVEIVENDVLIVSVLGADGSYFMWQKGLTEEVGLEDGIYFEFDDQINGGHNIVNKCTVNNDCIHVLIKGELKIFYFPSGFDKYRELQDGLEKIYSGQKGVLEFSF